MLIENLTKFDILINRKPELVEKKEPPIITNIKKIKDKLFETPEKEIPKFDTLLQIDTKEIKNVFFSLKKTNVMKRISSKNNSKYKSSVKRFNFLFFKKIIL